MPHLDRRSISVNETYKVWKKHAPFLYNLLQTYELQTASLTLDWFSEVQIRNNWTYQRLLLGTNSNKDNQLQIVEIARPSEDALTDYSSYIESRQPAPEQGTVGHMGQQTLIIVKTIQEQGPIYRARVCPQEQSLIAVKVGGNNPKLAVYKSGAANGQELDEPFLTLSGHLNEGFGLEWSPYKALRVGSCSYDRKVLVWDLGKGARLLSETLLTKEQQDISWSAEQHVYAVCGHDEAFNVFDMREKNGPVITKSRLGSSIYSLDFCPLNKDLLLVGSQKGDISLWDLRYIDNKLHSFIGHESCISSLTWRPNSASQFASGSQDSKVVIWNLENIITGKDRSTAEEIQFIHGGHRSKVTEVSWDPNSCGIASCQEANLLHVWEPAQSLQHSSHGKFKI